MSRNPAELTKYGIDASDFGKGASRFEHVLQNELVGDAFGPARVALIEAWDSHVQAARKSFDERMDFLLHQLPAAVGQPKADILLDICKLSEKYIARAPRLFWLADAQLAADVLCATIVSPSLVLRVLTLMALGHMTADVVFLRAFYKNRGHQVLALSLDRHHSQESEAALNVMQRVLENRLALPGPPFPLALCYRLATMIDPSDELGSLTPQRRFRSIQLALLVVKASPAQSAAADLVRLLLGCATSRHVTPDESELIVSGILSAFDEPKRRAYIKDADLAPVFIPFTDASALKATAEHIAVMNTAKDILCRIMTTWTGLLWVASEGLGLRALMDVLHLPGPLDRKMVLLTLFNQLLRRLAPHRGIAPLPCWLGEDIDRRQRTVTQGPTDFDMVNVDEEFSGGSAADAFADLLHDELEDDAVPTTKSVGYQSMDALLGAALLVLEHHGLPQALISIVKRSADENTSVVLAQEAAVLFQHILVLMDCTLPRHTGSSLHSALSSAVAELSQRGNVLVGSLTSKLFQQAGGNLSASSISGAPTMVLHVDTAQQLDDQAFQAMLKDTHVEQGEHMRWNLDALALLVYGPLRQTSRL